MTCESVAAWTHELRSVCGAGLLRCKGIIHVVGEREPIVLQGVARAFHPPVRLVSRLEGDLPTRIVVICEGVDRAAIEETLALLSTSARIVQGNMK